MAKKGQNAHLIFRANVVQIVLNYFVTTKVNSVGFKVRHNSFRKIYRYKKLSESIYLIFVR